MVPLVASALIGAGSSLLGGIFGGLGKKQDAKQQLAGQKALMEQQRANDLKNAEMLKPKDSYYNYGKSAPAMDYVFQNALMNWMDSTGQAKNLGIDTGAYKNAMGLNTPIGTGQSQYDRQVYNQPSQFSAPKPNLGGMRQSGGGALAQSVNAILDKYNRKV